MPYRNGIPYYGAYGGDNTAFQARNSTTSRQLSESTQKLFKAIDDENLEAFKQALEVGADVNAFDKEGMTPLMSIVNLYAVSGDGQATLEKMAKLLIQNRSIDINTQSKQLVPITGLRYDLVARGEELEFTITDNIRKDTALHIAYQVGAKDIVKILLTHPDVKTDVENCEHKSPKDCIARAFEDIIKLEFEKAQKGKQLLTVLSRNIHLAKTLLNQELNPNCWKRSQSEEIETPLSLIVKSCLEGITEDKKEVLTKLLKHKDLDFSQIKPIQAIERNPQLKQIIEQAIKERLIDTINKKNLDDVKKLAEDHCFMSHAIVTAALRNASEPTKSIKNYLNEKFPTSVEQPVANTHNVQPEINDEFIAKELQQLENLRNELERTKAQLVEKEQELTNKTDKILQLERDLRQVKQEKLSQQTKINDLNSEVTRLNRIVYGRTSDTDKISQLERDRLSSENGLLRTKSPSNKNEKSSKAISPGRKQSNCASASFALSGAFAVGACLTISSLAICIPLAVAAFIFFTVGCCCLYKANTMLSDVKGSPQQLMMKL